MEKSRKLIPAGKIHACREFFPLLHNFKLPPEDVVFTDLLFSQKTVERARTKINDRESKVLSSKKKKEKKGLLTDYPENPKYIFRSSFLASEQAVTRKTMYIEVI